MNNNKLVRVIVIMFVIIILLVVLYMGGCLTHGHVVIRNQPMTKVELINWLETRAVVLNQYSMKCLELAEKLQE